MTTVSLTDLRPDVYPYKSATSEYVAPQPPSDGARRIADLIQTLPDLEADILTLVYRYGMTQEAAASVLSLSQPTVARRLAAALSRLYYWYTRPNLRPSETRAGLSALVDRRGWPLLSPDVVETVTDYVQTGNTSLTARRLGLRQQDVHATVRRARRRLSAAGTISALFYDAQIADAQGRPVRIRQLRESYDHGSCAYRPDPPTAAVFASA